MTRSDAAASRGPGSAPESKRRGPQRSAAQVAPPISDLYGQIGARVREQRLTLDWTIEELALASGVNRATLSQLENGRRDFSVGTLDAVARGLGVALRALMPD